MIIQVIVMIVGNDQYVYWRHIRCVIMFGTGKRGNQAGNGPGMSAKNRIDQYILLPGFYQQR